MFSKPIGCESVEVDIFDASTTTKVSLTESGTIDVEFREKLAVEPDEDIGTFMGLSSPKLYHLEGKTEKDDVVKFQNTILSPSMKAGPNSGLFVNDINPSIIIFDSSDNEAIVGSEVTIEFDILSLQPTIPFIERAEPVTLLDRDNWSISAESLDDRERRIELIKEYRRLLRTATVEIKQEVNGPPCIQVQKALERLGKIIELLSFLQGVTPCPIRARVTEIDGQKTDYRYEKWMTNYSRSIGHAFIGPRIVWSDDIQQFLDDSYDDYATGLRDRYSLNMVINWYLDALNNTRSLDSKFASICSGIELLAKRHSDQGPRYTKTEDRIKYVVKELKVEVRDLAEFAGTYENSKLDDKNYANEYFYEYSRQYVMHGDNLGISFDNLFKDYEASLRLFQRLLRNQLISTDDLDKYHTLRELTPENRRYE